MARPMDLKKSIAKLAKQKGEARIRTFLYKCGLGYSTAQQLASGVYKSTPRKNGLVVKAILKAINSYA